MANRSEVVRLALPDAAGPNPDRLGSPWHDPHAPVYRSEDAGPEAQLQDGHRRRIKHWRCGPDHVIVEWYAFEDADVSGWVGFARDEEGGAYGLVPISEEEFSRRCADVRQQLEP